ncbi:MAG: hypothetical protein ACR2OU_04300, partial [Thermomicrobiales bacterium]
LDPIWEYAGISSAESAGLAHEIARNPEGRTATLSTSHALAIVISSGQIDSIALPLTNTGTSETSVRLHIRQATHLRDFGAAPSHEHSLAAFNETMTPGQSTITFKPAKPILCEPNAPVVLILESNADLSWALSWQEPPGTQTAYWDESLGYWRWMHGTLGFDLSPVSMPYAAINVLSGITRPEVGTNLWISDPQQDLPQTLAIHWPDPIEISQIELTFDSQLSGWIWEGAFPLIAQNYDVEICDPSTNQWQTVASIEDNVQRRRLHRFGTQRTTALRITIRATQGGRTARIVEVRAYAETSPAE